MTRSRVKNDFSIGIDDSATSTKLTVTNSGVAGTLTTAAQPNITSVGTLTGFTSTGIDDNADATAITIGSDEDVTFTGGVKLDGRNASIGLKLDMAGSDDYVIKESSSNDIMQYGGGAASAFYHNISSGSLRLGTAGGGISFNGDTAAANALDDYEEGTFTPTISSGVNSISYGARTGHYTKIGNFVYCDIYIYYSGTGSGAQFIVSSLPFTQKNTNYIRGGGCSSYQNRVGSTVQFYGSQGTTYFYCYVDGSTTFTTSGTVGNYLIGTFTYIAA